MCAFVLRLLRLVNAAEVFPAGYLALPGLERFHCV
jgi:hypothetical protein